MTISRSQRGRWHSTPLLPGAVLLFSAILFVALGANRWYSPAACPRSLRQLPAPQRVIDGAIYLEDTVSGQKGLQA